ncbi:FeoA family protein [Ruficoccus sp. ZRK36]|uniref:FeoA family protein n=1 Tax=Ruficoccus sp. ZRK36 TaxID=2866311 RepID=UPI001C733655|nr:FeoA family protein [Ruficoccus sp. ZRK36]QYY36191.1 ferrous iron transport protein A [Ruficoccus sp. ZRK36]
MNTMASTCILSEMKPGEGGILDSFNARNGTLLRLHELGLTPGQNLKVVRISPLGDPIEIKLPGFHLCLRKTEASAIEVRRA